MLKPSRLSGDHRFVIRLASIKNNEGDITINKPGPNRLAVFVPICERVALKVSKGVIHLPVQVLSFDPVEASQGIRKRLPVLRDRYCPAPIAESDFICKFTLTLPHYSQRVVVIHQRDPSKLGCSKNSNDGRPSKHQGGPPGSEPWNQIQKRDGKENADVAVWKGKKAINQHSSYVSVDVLAKPEYDAEHDDVAESKQKEQFGLWTLPEHPTGSR